MEPGCTVLPACLGGVAFISGGTQSIHGTTIRALFLAYS